VRGSAASSRSISSRSTPAARRRVSRSSACAVGEKKERSPERSFTPQGLAICQPRDRRPSAAYAFSARICSLVDGDHDLPHT
jgi:hypothetical protein